MANVSLVQAVRVAARAAAIVTKQSDQLLPKNATQKVWFWYADPAEKREEDAEPAYTIKVAGKKGSYVATCDCPHRRKADLMAAAEAEGKRVAPYQGPRCKHSTAVLHQLEAVDIIEYLKGLGKVVIGSKEFDLHAEATTAYQTQAGIRITHDKGVAAKERAEEFTKQRAENALRFPAVQVRGKGQNTVLLPNDRLVSKWTFSVSEGEEPAAMLARAQSVYPAERYVCSIVQVQKAFLESLTPLS